MKGTNATILTSIEVPEKDLTGKWIIITGANNGIGFEAAKTFAKWGANLILACREPPEWETHPSVAEKECNALAESAGHASIIEWWKLDLTDLGSIDRFATKWVDTNRPLHILCNNAGVTATPGAETIYTKDGFEYTHQVSGTPRIGASNSTDKLDQLSVPRLPDVSASSILSAKFRAKNCLYDIVPPFPWHV